MDLQEFNAHRAVAQTRSGEISYVTTGTGDRTAVFIHGLGTNAYIWSQVLGQLRDEHRCVALDLPMHGRSPAPTDRPLSLPMLAEAVEDLCDTLGLTGIDLVTNNTGGAVGQIFVARHPERLRSLVLTNCEAHDNLPNEAFRNTVELAKRGELAPVATRMLEDLDMSRSRGIGTNFERPERLTDELIRTFLEPVAGSPEAIGHFQQLLASLDPADLLAAESGLRQLTVPTMLVWGTGDIHFELKWAYWLRDLIPGATEVVEVEGGKLFFPFERAPELVTHLRRHWAGS